MKSIVSIKSLIRIGPFAPVAVTFAMVLYFAHELSRYTSGVRVLEEALMDQVTYHDQELTMLVRAIQIALSRYPSNHPEYRSVIHLRHRLRQLVLSHERSVEKQLASIVSLLDAYLESPEDKPRLEEEIGGIVPLSSRKDKAMYHKSRVLNTYYQYFLEQTSSKSLCGTSPFHLIQYYDPVMEKYVIHLSYKECEECSWISVNGNVTADGKFIYRPERPGIHTFEIIVQSVDFERFRITYDTIEYAIKVVDDKGGV